MDLVELFDDLFPEVKVVDDGGNLYVEGTGEENKDLAIKMLESNEISYREVFAMSSWRFKIE